MCIFLSLCLDPMKHTTEIAMGVGVGVDREVGTKREGRQYRGRGVFIK